MPTEIALIIFTYEDSTMHRIKLPMSEWKKYKLDSLLPVLWNNETKNSKREQLWNLLGDEWKKYSIDEVNPDILTFSSEEIVKKVAVVETFH